MKVLQQNEAFGLATPCPYTLVTSLDKDGRPNALGVSWVTRTSFDPCLMLISIAHNRYSHEGIALHKEFVVNYPSEDQEEAAWICGTKTGRYGDKLNETGLALIDSLAVNVPTIKDVTVAFECKVIDQLTTGDHTVFVGEVVAMRGNNDKPKHLYVTSNYTLFAVDDDVRNNPAS